MSLNEKLVVNLKEGYLLNRLRQALDSLEPNLGSNYFDLELFKDQEEDGKLVFVLKKIEDRQIIDDLEKKKKKRKQKKKKSKKLKSPSNEVQADVQIEVNKEAQQQPQEEVHDDDTESSNEDFDNESFSLSVVESFKSNVQNKYKKLIINIRNEYVRALEQQGVSLSDAINELIDFKSFIKAFNTILNELSFVNPKLIFSKSIESFILYRQNDESLSLLADFKQTHQLINLHAVCEFIDLRELIAYTSNTRIKSFYEYVQLGKELKANNKQFIEQKNLNWKLFKKSFITKPIDGIIGSDIENTLLGELVENNIITIVIYVPSCVTIDESAYFNESFTNHQVNEALKVLEDTKLRYKQGELDKNGSIEYIRNKLNVNNTLTREIENRFISFI